MVGKNKNKIKVLIISGLLAVGLFAVFGWSRPSAPHSPLAGSNNQNTSAPTTKSAKPAPAAQPDSPPANPGEVAGAVVKTTHANQIVAYATSHHLVISDRRVLSDGQTTLLTLDKSADDPQVKALASTVPDAQVGNNIVYHAVRIPNDPIYPQWHTDKISAPAAWDATTGSAGVTVAVIDTGFTLNHEDLAGRWAPGGKDFIHNDNDPSAGTDNPSGKGVSHGTMVAGLLGAATNNGVGIAGVNWQSPLLPLQALNDDGAGYTSALTAAIDYAVSQGVKVINMSLGTTQSDFILQAMITKAINAGVVVVAAAGNCGDPATYQANGCSSVGQMIYPASYPAVVAVGATDSSDNRASFSSYGPNLDIMAPGAGAIRTPIYPSGYSSSANGTSFAASIVSGIISLIRSQFPSASVSEVVDKLTQNADKVAGLGGQGRTDFYGYGRVNARASVFAPVYTWQLESIRHGAGTAVTDIGQDQTIQIKARNTGNVTWTKAGVNPVRLGTWEPGRVSRLATSSWLNPTRPANLTEDSVDPGQVGTFTFSIHGGAPGEYFERFNLVAENLRWFNDVGAQFYIKVGGTFAWQPVWQSISTGNPNIGRGETFDITVRARNTGDTAWTKAGNFPIRLATTQPQNRGSGLYYQSWISDIRPSGLVEDSVPPGGEGTFTFTARTPGSPGARYEHFSLVAEGLTWLNDPGLTIYINVQ